MSTVSLLLDPTVEQLVIDQIADIFPDAEEVLLASQEADYYISDVVHFPSVPAGKTVYVWPDGYKTTGRRKKPKPTEFRGEVKLIKPLRDFKVVNVEDAIHHEMLSGGLVAMDTETVGLEDQTLLGVSVSRADHQGIYVVGPPERLKQFAQGYALYNQVIWHNAPFDLRAVGDYHAYNHDTMVAAWLLNKPKLSLSDLAHDVLGERHLNFTDILAPGEKVEPAKIPEHLMMLKSCGDVDHTRRVFNKLQPQLQELGLYAPLYTDIEIPLIKVLLQMSDRGLRVDASRRDTLRQRSEEQLGQVAAALDSMGLTFKRNDPEQLAHYLYEKEGLPVVGLTKGSRKPSVDRKALQQLETLHPAVPLLMMERDLRKQLSTFLSGDGDEVHARFNQCSVVTGRLSCAGPNLQQVPSCDPCKGEGCTGLRHMYVARPGHVFVAADYAQVELRIATYMSKEPRWQAAFAEGRSLHEETMKLFNVPKRVAKAINFGILYGAEAQKVGEMTGLNEEQTKEVLRQHKSAYPMIWDWVARTRDEARKTGMVRSLPPSGRVRLLPNLASSSDRLIAESLREAVNTPIQATSADITKDAMLALSKLAPIYGAHLVLQIHDELVYEVPEDSSASWLEVMQTVMVDTPHKPEGLQLAVDGHVGRDWGQLK